jgi:hypothetical protein
VRIFADGRPLAPHASTSAPRQSSDGGASGNRNKGYDYAYVYMCRL